jgi:cardiolipin synthase
MGHQHVGTIEIKEDIIVNARSYFEQLINAINEADQEILLESYIFESDLVGQAISQALENAALRGVSVRVLVDGVGAGNNFGQIAKQLINCGAEVKVYRPLPWRFDLWPLSLVPSKGIFKLWYLLSYINKRDHRKVILIDRRLVFLGSFNITQSHLPRELGGSNFSDTAIKVTGPGTHNVRTAFEACWNKSSLRKSALNTSSKPFIFNFTRRLRRSKRRQLIQRIKSANNSVWISNAYFVPDKGLLEALCYASKKGVDVRLLLPGQSDIAFIPWASSYFYSTLLDSGIRIYEYNAGILHSKTMIVDDWACVGSSNLNTRSLMHDLEIDYSLQLESSKQQLAINFRDDLKQSDEYCTETLDQNRTLQRYVGGLLLLLFSYWV